MFQFTVKLSLKNPDKNMALANLSITTHGKILNLNTTTINLKYMLQLGMMNLIDLMDLIRFLIFKAILNISSRNMKLLQMILLYKFMSIK